MGFYSESQTRLGIEDALDVTNDIPINIDIKNESKKNKEIQGLIDYINKSKIDLTKVIFVMDRAYFSYELFKTLNDKNIKFVIRVRNNCQHLQKYLNENKEKNCKENHKPKKQKNGEENHKPKKQKNGEENHKPKKQKNGEENHKPKKQKNGEENHKPKKQKINQKLKNVRFITYNATVKETKRNKQKEEVSILRQLECNIATNLNTTISDESIKEMYTSRWDIEIFFKLIKRNFSCIIHI